MLIIIQIKVNIADPFNAYLKKIEQQYIVYDQKYDQTRFGKLYDAVW